MRILHVIAGAPQGGAELFMAEACAALHEAGLDQAAIMRPGPRADALAMGGVMVRADPFRKWPRGVATGAVRSMIKDLSPDLVQFWMRRAGDCAPRENFERNIAWYGAYYDPRHFRHCAWHCAVTEDVARWLSEARALPADRIGVVHTFSDLASTAPVDRAAAGATADVFLVLALARLDPVKGLDTLIDAIAAAPGMHLWIAGEGPERARLQKRIHGHDAQERIRLLGWREDRAALLAAADALAFPSRGDSFGTVMLEAWQAGVPLVAAAAPGPAAYVAHEETGLICPIDDVAALTGALSRLHADASLRARLVEGGRTVWRERFSKPAFVAAQIAFYERALQCVGRGGIGSAREASR